MDIFLHLLTVLVPAPHQSADEFANAYYHKWIQKVEKPENLLADNGSCYRSHIAKLLSEIYGYNQKFSSPYSPTGNAFCERTNGIVKQALANIGYDLELEQNRMKLYDLVMETSKKNLKKHYTNILCK